MVTKITKEDVKANMKDVSIKTVEEFGRPMVLVTVRMANGFLLHESSTCVASNNYSEAIGAAICLKRIEEKVWMLLGYELQSRINNNIETWSLATWVHSIRESRGFFLYECAQCFYANGHLYSVDSGGNLRVTMTEPPVTVSCIDLEFKKEAINTPKDDAAATYIYASGTEFSDATLYFLIVLDNGDKLERHDGTVFRVRKKDFDQWRIGIGFNACYKVLAMPVAS